MRNQTNSPAASAQSTETQNRRVQPAGQDASFEPLTLRLAWLMAAPHTWPAAIMPALIATSAALAATRTLSASMVVVLLLICLLMQSAVNVLNDYFDFVKGADSEQDDVDPSDAILVYHQVKPSAARNLAIGLLVAAFLLGAYAIWYAGWIPLAIGAIGALIVFLYSGGKTPISYLPIGEVVSGVVMGGLIPLACFQVLTRSFSWLVLLWAIPTIIGVGLIMFTNNTCDIEKDVAARRKTLPVVLGRAKSVAAYHALLVVWIVSIVIIVGIWFTPGLIAAPFMLLAAYPFLRALWGNPLAPGARIAAMSQIATVNVCLGSFYALAIVAGSVANLVF